MRKLMSIFIAVACLGIMGCGARSVEEITTNPAYHIGKVTNHGYQAAIKIIRDKLAGSIGDGVMCTNYSDLKMGECSYTMANGTMVYATAKYITDDTARVDFYSAMGSISGWPGIIQNAYDALR